MKKLPVFTFIILMLLAFSFTSKAGAPESKPKYASVNVFFQGLAKPKLFVIVDGKTETTVLDGGFMDKEAGEGPVFTAVQAALEKLGEQGYKLVTTAALAPSFLTYTLMKE